MYAIFILCRTVLNALKKYEEAIDHLNQAVEIFEHSKAVPANSIEKIVTYIKTIQKKLQQQ